MTRVHFPDEDATGVYLFVGGSDRQMLTRIDSEKADAMTSVPQTMLLGYFTGSRLDVH
jgi:hypothetical protein